VSLARLCWGGVLLSFKALPLADTLWDIAADELYYLLVTNALGARTY
jgi:hypothetical protein